MLCGAAGGEMKNYAGLPLGLVEGEVASSLPVTSSRFPVTLTADSPRGRHFFGNPGSIQAIIH